MLTSTLQLSTCTLALLLAGTSVFAQQISADEPFERRGIKVCITLQEFRMLSHPNRPEAKPICQNDKGKFPKLIMGWPFASIKDERPGEHMQCRFGVPRKHTYTSGGKLVDSGNTIIDWADSMGFSDQSITTQFSFWREKADDEFRLMKISHLFRHELYPLVSQGLRRKYANLEITRRTQKYTTGFGGHIEGESIWISNSRSMISAYEYSSNLGISSMDYYCEDLFNQYGSLLDEKNADLNRM